jgi:hypothetical protein
MFWSERYSAELEARGKITELFAMGGALLVIFFRDFQRHILATSTTFTATTYKVSLLMLLQICVECC